MPSENVVMLIGHVGRDAECRYTQGGTAVANFSLATSDGWGDSKRTNWHNITIWGKQAETAAKFVRKGRQVSVVGVIGYEDYMKDGVKVYKTVITCQRFQLLGKKEQDTGPDAYDIGDLSGNPLGGG